MRHFILLLVISTTINISSQAQKKLIDNDSYKNWIILKDIKANKSSITSNDGKYIVYKYGSIAQGDFFTIQSLNGNYKVNIKIRKEGTNTESSIDITEDSKKVVFLKEGDSLGILTLGNSYVHYIKNVTSFNLSKSKNGEWLTYIQNKNELQLVLINLSTNVEKRISNFGEFKFNPDGTVMVVKLTNSVMWFDLINSNDYEVCNGVNAFHLTFDKSGTQLAFNNVDKKVQIYYYKKGMKGAKILLEEENVKLKGGFRISNDELNFSPDGNILVFNIENRDNSEQNGLTNLNNSKIYSYNDKFLVHQNSSQTEKASTDLKNPSLVELDTKNLTIYDLDKNNYLLGISRINMNEFYWNNDTCNLYLISIKNGSRKLVTQFSKSITAPFFMLSPGERFVIWMDAKDKQYYSYEIATEIVRNISKKVPEMLSDQENDIPNRREAFGVAGWMTNDKRLFVYDEYDIWILNPVGVSPPINATRGYGRKNNTILRKLGEDDTILKNSFLLSGFNKFNKKNGFFTFSLKNEFKPKDKTMGNYLYCNNYSSNEMGTFVSKYFPQPINNTKLYIVRRMSSSQSPNLFLTSDFINFQSLTNFHPEKEYNWMSTKLINWTLTNGRRSMGILYVPENLDSTKKYPIIFHYYEKRSDELNEFKNPHLSSGDLSIPWYINHGFLIFVPDMQYETGYNYLLIKDNILSAVNELKKYSWVDTENMGLQGHSFGGYQTLILIGNVNLFKAAQESSGPSDLTVGYSHVFGDVSRQHFFDFDQPNLGGAPWDKSETFVKNSPIYNALNIQTPLLIMHNENDAQVEYSQATEIFLALRRLKKPVWLIKYDNEGHGIREIKNQLDFTIKQQQFFNYYLHAGARPDWLN